MATEHWATQSPVTDPGAAAGAIDALDPSLPALRQASSQLVFHYRAGDYARAGVDRARMAEIDTRFAAPMLARLVAADASLARSPRPGASRTVGCCRDAAVLFLALARRRGVPARARVGFASYIVPGWWMDHVVVDVWDAAEGRWRLVEPELEEDLTHPDGHAMDFLELRRGVDFLVGPAAWIAARKGEVDHEKFVVAPQLQEAMLRGWPYLAHNVVHDLAALDKKEMLLWDVWGSQERWENAEAVTDEDAALLDEISPRLVNLDITPEEVAELAGKKEYAIPREVTTADPLGGPLRQVDVSKVLGAA